MRRIQINTIREWRGSVYASALVASESKPGTYYETHVIVGRVRVGGVWAVMVLLGC